MAFPSIREPHRVGLNVVVAEQLNETSLPVMPRTNLIHEMKREHQRAIDFAAVILVKRQI